MSNHSNYISIRAYAKKVGVDEKAVRAAIKEGKISRGVVYFGEIPKIDALVADVEWAAAINPDHNESQKVAKALIPDRTGADSATESTHKARQAQQIYKAKLLQLEYEERKGKLVEKDAVYRALFGIGKEIKEAILAVPDRVIDDIIASDSRHKAHTLLRTALEEALEALANLDKRKIP